MKIVITNHITFLLSLFIFSITFANEEIISLQKKTIKTHESLININTTIKKLDTEIKQNRQLQLIFKNKINEDETLAQNLIELLQKNYNIDLLKEFLKKYPNYSSFLSDRIISKFYFDLIKNDINEYFIDLSKIEKLDLELKKKVLSLNQEKIKLRKNKKKLENELNKKVSLQRKSLRNKIYKKKERKIKKKSNNLNDLVLGISGLNKQKDKLTHSNKKIRFPVEGEITSKFGEIKDSFPLKNGIMFQLKDNPYVISPINGIVVFSGKFRSYGNLIIIENSDNYHTILSGMDKILTTSGNRVLVGEPIAKYYSDDVSKKKIYFELRFKGKAIDPKKEVEIL